ncbi:hypothetical protein CKM354_000830600 [Cercospora kikuchii]|uniref:Uncharacterized protein n=1 Tax=Cercospora kikuchii TaxID=84275 RepID=A0A9P3CLR0_9PEZI|nr:uncharacterized protein CKM354_000830600 [Cercospora kikuchii]GIZ45124.1 hypothetical protein CKM354_000830600 [Cercospora kikuchii]
MFKALLLATVAGVGAANGPAPASELIARNNYPPSYLCSNVNKKCSGNKAKASVTAYCSSLLKVPKSTTTKKSTVYCTTTKTTVVATITKPASVVTSTVSCAAPATTPPIDDEPPEGGDETPDPEVKIKRDANAPKGYGPNIVHKPSCFSSYTKSAQLTSACKCASIKPRTTTVTSTVKVTREAKSTVSVTSTVTTDTSTIYAVPTFGIVNEDDQYLRKGAEKSTRSGVAFGEQDSAVLFELNEAGVLVSEEGEVAVELFRDDGNPEIYLRAPSPTEKALTCSISYEATDFTCPLVCQYEISADRNLVVPPSEYSFGRPPWWVAEPDEEKGLTATFKTYAVSRGQCGDRGGRGGFGCRGGSRMRSRRTMR